MSGAHFDIPAVVIGGHIVVACALGAIGGQRLGGT
jgi:hypothetical protein